VLAYLIKGLIGRVQVRYDDERVRVMRAGKTGAGAKVAGVIREIPALSAEEIAGHLPLPSPESWKFAAALPARDFQAMVLADYYHTGEFTRTLAQVPVILMPDAEPGAAKTESGE
jgi:hypothetical protein